MVEQVLTCTLYTESREFTGGGGGTEKDREEQTLV
jgi:hypothetical protein